MGNGTANAKTGGYTYKQKQYGPNDSFDNRVILRLARNMDISDPQKALDGAKQVVSASGNYRQNEDGSKTFANGLRISKPTWSVYEQVKQELRSAGTNEAGYTEWSPDEQLMSRPVMFSWEIRDADADKSIILQPGLFNLQLRRFKYYSDPVLSKWARSNPNLPPSIVDPGPAAVPVAAFVPSAPPAGLSPIATPQPQPADDNAPLGNQLADLGKDLTKKAAGAAADYLKNKWGSR